MNDKDKQKPSPIVLIVVISIAALAFISVSSLCLTLFYKNYADPAVLSALISTSGTLTGSLVTILVNTRRSGDIPVTVTNPPENPVQVEAAPAPPIV